MPCRPPEDAARGSTKRKRTKEARKAPGSKLARGVVQAAVDKKAAELLLKQANLTTASKAESFDKEVK